MSLSVLSSCLRNTGSLQWEECLHSPALLLLYKESLLCWWEELQITCEGGSQGPEHALVIILEAEWKEKREFLTNATQRHAPRRRW